MHFLIMFWACTKTADILQSVNFPVPELSGVNSLLFFFVKEQEKGGTEDPRVSGVNFLLFLVRDLGGSKGLGSSNMFFLLFLLVFSCVY